MRLVVTTAFISVIICVTNSFAASADTSLQEGTLGFNADFSSSSDVLTLSARYFLADDLAVQAGFGFQVSSGDVDADFFSIVAGARKYFRTDEFAPFMEGSVAYINEKMQSLGIDTTTFELSGNFGAEFFLQKQFSIEGSVGARFGAVEDDRISQDYTYFGTRTVGVSANFYF
jgi:hypothetical protein